MTKSNYQKHKIKYDEKCETVKNVVNILDMLNPCNNPVQDDNVSCTQDSECQWIACNSSVCCRKNLTCITPERARPYTMSRKSPNIKLSSIIKAKFKLSESLLPLNINDAESGNSSSSSAIKCTQCTHTIHRLDLEENITYYHTARSCSCLGASSDINGRITRHNIYPITASRRAWSFRDGWFHFLILLLMFTSSVCVGANELSAETDLAYANKSDVCRDNYDIRNDPQQFKKLRGCRVIEGYLQILLFDNYNESSYEGISFPELREINDYLMLYRVFGLRTLSKLFPNLSVIGGKRRFQNYALIIYEMQDMQEIGLVSLTNILEGAVRIEKNPQLCYASTVDWTLIAKKAKRDEHMILDNKKANECPSCPGVDTELSHGLRCPESSHEHHSTTKSRRLCWNQHHCQKVCPAHCNGTCDNNNNCCDDKCIAGCPGNRTNCTACKHFRLGDTKDFKCVEKCPADTLVFQGRRCVTEQECREMPSPRGFTFPQSSSRLSYKSFNNSCILLCPNNYIQTEKQDGNLTCEPCSDYNDCRKECDGGVVDNISSAQKLKYCTHIKQSLEIKIMGAINIVKELEENLAMIQEIKGYLKVVRSYPLVSLNFLKSLKSIRGEELENNRSSLVVMDNANLQDLWDWDKHEPIKIGRGIFSFHFNPKLCVNKIDKLRNITNVHLSSTPEIDQNSNGDRVACDVRPLRVSVSKTSKFAAIIKWEPFKYEDPRVLLGYVVSRMKAPYKNVTVYDGRDACGGDGWIVKDVANSDTQEFTHLFTHLESYTQYAFYVKTYTLASETIGAQSPVLYFTTKPDQPSPPLKMAVHSNSSSELVVKWEPPLKPNGNVTHYIIEVKYQADVNDRNYCKDAIKPEEIQTSNTNDVTTPSTTEPACDCANELENKPKIIGQAEADSIISFEDQLQDQVYVKFEGNKNDRYKRMIPHADMVMVKERYSETAQKNFEANSSMGTNSNSSVHLIIKTNSTTYVIRELKHFALYSINLRACREKVEEEEDDKLCSESKMRNERTLKLDGADDITVFKVEVLQTNQSLGEVEITWEEPKAPNGLIYTYQIEYNRVDLVDAKPVPICVTYQDFIDRRRSYVVQKLTAGNYSIRVMAVSKAGNGKFSDMKYFLILAASTGPSAGAIIGFTILAFILVLMVLFLAFRVYRKHYPPASSIKLITSVNPEYMSMQYQPDEWEVPREKIKLIRELGQGSFGMVYEGIACDLVRNDPEIKCAIKTVNVHATDRERIEFLNEASVMKAFDTAHVVRLLGVVSRGQPTLVVMELMANGDLKSYLRSHRPDAESFDPEVCMQPPSLKRILQMAIEIADGMAYLSAKKFVHRDLAARNCMVSDNLTVKIGDFGMTRDIYETDYYRKGSKGLLPVRWMAPESLKDGVFTSGSDVWSYGVVLWEMATLASQPYQGLSNDQVLRYVIDGGVMERPENCPDQLYELMRLTWQHKPSARPSFFELESLLHADANPEFRKISFYHSPQGQEALMNMQTIISANDDPATPLRHTDDDDYHSDFDAQNPTQQLPKGDLIDKPFVLERLLSRRDKETAFDLDQKVGSYQDSVSYIGSTPGTSYGHRDKDFAEDAGSIFGSRSPAFYSITNKSNTTSPDRNVSRDNIKDSSFRDIFKDQEEAETQFSSTAPMLLPSANGYIVSAIGSNNGSANIKTAEC